MLWQVFTVANLYEHALLSWDQVAESSHLPVT